MLKKKLLNLIGLLKKGAIGDVLMVTKVAIVPRSPTTNTCNPNNPSGFIPINERMLKNVLNLIGLFKKWGLG